MQSVANQGGQIGAQMRGNRLQKEQNELSKSNAYSTSGDRAGANEVKSLEASQKAFSSPSPENELAAFNSAKVSREAHMEAARAAGNIGNRGAETFHQNAAKEAESRMEHHQEALSKMAADSKSAYDEAAKAPVTSPEGHQELATLARQAAAAENAYGSVSPGVKSDAEGGMGPKEYIKAAEAHERAAKTMSAVTPNQQMTNDGGDGSGA